MPFLILISIHGTTPTWTFIKVSFLKLILEFIELILKINVIQQLKTGVFSGSLQSVVRSSMSRFPELRQTAE